MLLGAFPSDSKWSADELKPLANIVYRRIQEALSTQGLPNLQAQVEVTLPAGETQLGDRLPENLVFPLRLWERTAGSEDQFITMRKSNNDLPTLVDLADRLFVWNWFGNDLRFIGATQDVELRLRYESTLDDLTYDSPGDVIVIRGSENAVVLGITAYAISANSTKEKKPLDPFYYKLFQDELHQLVNRSVRPEQRRGRRMRPFGALRVFFNNS